MRVLSAILISIRNLFRVIVKKATFTFRRWGRFKIRPASKFETKNDTPKPKLEVAKELGV